MPTTIFSQQFMTVFTVLKVEVKRNISRVKSMMKDGWVLKLVLLKKPTETVKAVVALAQPKYLHAALVFQSKQPGLERNRNPYDLLHDISMCRVFGNQCYLGRTIWLVLASWTPSWGFLVGTQDCQNMTPKTFWCFKQNHSYGTKKLYRALSSWDSRFGEEYRWKKAPSFVQAKGICPARIPVYMYCLLRSVGLSFCL